MAPFRFVRPEPPAVPGNPIVHWDFTDISVLFQDTGNSTPVTADGQSVNSVDDKGSLGVTLATNHNGTPNAPTYVENVNNGFSGLLFDGDNTEGLTSDDYDMSRVVTMLCICIRPLRIMPLTGSMLSGPSQDTYLRVISATTNIQVISVGSKASIVDSPNPPKGGFAAWSNGTDNSGEVRLSTRAGVDTKTGIAPSNPAAAPSGVGCDEGGASGFVSGTVLEILVWDNAVSAVPTTTQMEEYASGKHSIVWN